MDPKLKIYLDERFDAVDDRFDAVDARFESIETRTATKAHPVSLGNNLSEQMQSVSNTTTKILNKLEDRMEALDEIVSDTGLGGRVHKLEIEVKEIKTRVA